MRQQIATSTNRTQITRLQNGRTVDTALWKCLHTMMIYLTHTQIRKIKTAESIESKKHHHTALVHLTNSLLATITGGLLVAITPC